MKHTFSPSVLLVFTASIAWSTSALAENWALDIAPSATVGSYQNSLLRERYSDVGIALRANYGKDWKMALGVNDSTVTQKNNAASITQRAAAVSGSWGHNFSALPGRVTTRMDVYRVTPTNVIGTPDTVDVLAPQVSWLAQDGSVYADLGYSRSKYANGQAVEQFTPTLGFGFNQAYDWIQLRSFQISGMNPLVSSGKNSTSAVAASWTHYLVKSTAYVPSSFTLGLMGGERLYSVDTDSMAVSNVADIQTGAANLSATWQLSKSTKGTLFLGQSRFRNVALDNDYQLNVGFASVNFGF